MRCSATHARPQLLFGSVLQRPQPAAEEHIALAKEEAVRLAHRDDAVEPRGHARLLKHLPLHRVQQVLACVECVRGE